MSDLLNNILRQKLMEIQGQLPPFVKLVKEPQSSFNDILSSQVGGTSSLGTEYSDEAGYNGDYSDLIENAARKYNINSAIIKAVIKAESNFNPSAVSSAGAMGLMQLMPDTAEGLGIKDAFDPIQNIDGGVRFLKNMLNQYGGSLELALAAYNAGPGNVAKYGGIPPFEETQEYIKRIMSYLKNRTFEK